MSRRAPASWQSDARRAIPCAVGLAVAVTLGVGAARLGVLGSNNYSRDVVEADAVLFGTLRPGSASVGGSC